MGNKIKQLSRQERKAKIRAAEDRIPDIPEMENDGFEVKGEGEPSGTRNDKNSFDTTNEAIKRKRKREHEVEQGRGQKQDAVGEEDTTTEKKRKRLSNEETIKIEKKTKKNEGIPDEGQKKEKRHDKKRQEKQTTSLTSASAEDAVERCAKTDEDLGRRKSKKERKAELKAAQRELGVEKVNSGNNGDTNGTTEAENIRDEKKAKSNGRKREQKNLVEKDDDTNHELAIDHDDNDTSEMQLAKSNKTTSAPKIPSNLSVSSSSTPMPPTITAKAARFIVFVGNLPYTATTTSIMRHFSKLQPLAVRHLTKKENPAQSRGMAFVEFKNYDTHKTALKIMHHSTFNDGLSEARKINVELTAGGGGNKHDRKAKIKHKNDRLNEQRTRRIQLEEQAKLDKTTRTEMPPTSHNNGIHPSRRRMIAV